MQRLVAIFAVGAYLSIQGTRAWAAEPASTRELSETTSAAESEARRLFFLGRDALKAGDFVQACRHFRASQELSSSPATLLNIGKCQEREGDGKGARESYERALRDARSHSDPERGELWAAAARKELDGLPVEDSAARVPMAAETSMVKAPAPAAEPRPMAPPSAAPSGAVDDRAARGSSSPSLLPWVLVGGGGLLVAGAVVTGVVSANAKSELDRECTPPTPSSDRRLCPSHLSDARTRARDFAVATDVLWIAGVASAAVGVTLMLTAEGSDGEPKTAARLGCHAGGCDAVVRGEF